METKEQNTATIKEMNTATDKAQKPKSKVRPFILAGIGIIVAFFSTRKIIYAMHNEDTENSQIECNINPVSARVSGFITKINVKENQKIKKGDTLVCIDNRDFLIRVKQAEINLANAEANLDVMKANLQASNASTSASSANVNTADASVESAKIRVWKATQDFNRYENLLKDKAVTQQQYDNAKAEKETADKQLIVAQKQLEASKDQSTATSAQSFSTEKQIKVAELAIEQRKSELDAAKLNLSYTYIIAPTDGYISKKNIQIGQLINVGQAMFSIVDESELWITANFKETQIENMKVGQPVVISVDAYPGKEFEGTIESIQAATGAKFSLLPPDNATGNFVKVVQRVPVRITVKDDKSDEYVLRAGMNVEVAVRVK